MGPKTHDIEPPRLTATEAQLADRLRERISTSPERVILGICGAPGAGKSTLADHLARLLGPETAVVVPFDGFHLAASALAGTGLMERRGAIETFDLGSYRDLIRRLRARDEDVVYAPLYSRDIEDPIASAIPVERSIPLVITEGNYLLADDPEMASVREHLDETWYLDVPFEVRLEQLIERHIEFGKSRLDAATWASGTDQLNAELIESTRHLADLVVTVGA